MKIVPNNDFGFTAMSTEQMRQTIPLSTEVQKTIKDRRVQRIMDTVVPLLEALQRDPDKDKLHWPQRAEVASKILQKIKNISEGKEDDVAERQDTQEYNGEGTDVSPD